MVTFQRDENTKIPSYFLVLIFNSPHLVTTFAIPFLSNFETGDQCKYSCK